MSNGPLIFYFLWVSTWEAMEEIFPSYLFQVVPPPPTWQRVQVCFLGSPTPAEADQAESQSQKK